MGFKDFYNDAVNVTQEVFVNQEEQTTVLNTEDKKDDKVSLRNTNVYGKKIDLGKYNGIVLEEKEPTKNFSFRRLHSRLDHISIAYRDNLNNKEWKSNLRKLNKELVINHNKLANITPAVNMYRKHTELINQEGITGLNLMSARDNKIYNHNIVFNHEDGLEGYIEVMNKVLSNTADSTDNLKSEIATMINGFISEVNGLKIDKYKEIILKVKSEISNRSNKIVSTVDKLLESLNTLDTVTLDSLKELIKTQEYLISSLGKDDTTVDKAIGADQGLKTEQINRLAETIMAYYNTAVGNLIVRDILTSDRDQDGVDHKLEVLGGALKGFMVDLLPHLNVTYKDILKLLRTQDVTIETLQPEQINDALKDTIDKNLVKFISHVGGFKIPEGTRTNLYHEQGYYILKEDGALYKHIYGNEKIDNVPNMNSEKLLYMSGILETVSVPSNVLVQFPKILIALLNSEAMIPNETIRLFNINLTLGVILGLIGMYRDELVFGIYGLSKSLSEVTDAYYNVIKAVENIAKR